MKKRLLVMMCVGVMLTGCTDHKFGGQEKPEVYLSLSQGSNDSVQGHETQPGDENAQNKERAGNLYTSFLNNEVPAVVGNDSQDGSILNNLEKGHAYTFEELGQCISQIYFDPEYTEKTTYDYAQYTYVECPGSDTENLLVKFVCRKIIDETVN